MLIFISKNTIIIERTLLHASPALARPAASLTRPLPMGRVGRRLVPTSPLLRQRANLVLAYVLAPLSTQDQDQCKKKIFESLSRSSISRVSEARLEGVFPSRYHTNS